MSNQNIYYLLLIAMLLMIAFAFAVIWFFTVAQKKIIGTKLRQKQAEMDFQKELLSNTITIQENERDRIAKELHDDIGSKLNIATLNVHLLKNKLTLDNDTQLILNRLYEALNNSAARTRAISHELIPPVFQNFGFSYALDELQNSINASGAITVNIANHQLVQITDKMKLLHIYRIIQELLNNTLKYAKASEIDINFEKDQDDITLQYKDNGIGFDTKLASKGMGYMNIHTRAKLLNGSLQYISSIGNGLLFTLKFKNDD